MAKDKKEKGEDGKSITKVQPTLETLKAKNRETSSMN